MIVDHAHNRQIHSRYNDQLQLIEMTTVKGHETCLTFLRPDQACNLIETLSTLVEYYNDHINRIKEG